MLIIRPHIFRKFPELIFGFSTRIGPGREAPFYFNLSFSVGDRRDIVEQNRNIFFTALGLEKENVAYQKQVHGDRISYISAGGFAGESDAMITDKPGTGLAITSADCAAIFLYDPFKKIIAAVHSGWRGSSKKILVKTLNRLRSDFNSSPENFTAYIGPSISQANYEVGKEVAELFEPQFVLKKQGKFFLDVSGFNYNTLLKAGLKKNNIQLSGLCSYDMAAVFHSYRRDGEKSGRSLGIIALKEQ
jgi:YfiH family protein